MLWNMCDVRYVNFEQYMYIILYICHISSIHCAFMFHVCGLTDVCSASSVWDVLNIGYDICVVCLARYG